MKGDLIVERRYRVTALTPVHVGTGETVPFRLGFFALERRGAVRVDFDLLFRAVSSDKMSDLLALLKKQDAWIGDIQETMNLQVGDIAADCYEGHRFRAGRNREGTAGTIRFLGEDRSLADVRLAARGRCTAAGDPRALPRVQLPPVIPASSLKGALRTCVLTGLAGDGNTLHAKGPWAEEFETSSFVRHPRKKSAKFAGQVEEDHYLRPGFRRQHGLRNVSGPNFDFLRTVRVRDVEFPYRALGLGRTFTQSPGGASKEPGRRFKEFVIGVECIRRGARGETTIAIDRGPRDGGCSRYQRDLGIEPAALDLDRLASLTQARARLAIEAELRRVERTFPLEEAVAPLKDLLAAVGDSPPKALVFPVGWGIGWLGMTGRLLNERKADNLARAYPLGRRSENFPFPKSRKWVQEGCDDPETAPLYPLGWIRMEPAG